MTSIRVAVAFDGNVETVLLSLLDDIYDLARVFRKDDAVRPGEPIKTIGRRDRGLVGIGFSILRSEHGNLVLLEKRDSLFHVCGSEKRVASERCFEGRKPSTALCHGNTYSQQRCWEDSSCPWMF